MQFQFDANQAYQLRAIEAVADLFRGQPRVTIDFRAFALGELFSPVGNRLDLDEAQLLENLRAVQADGGLAPDETLRCIEERFPILGGEQLYQGLKRLGRDTELIVYPGETHSIRRPSFQKDRYDRYIAWYSKYLKPKTGTSQ